MRHRNTSRCDFFLSEATDSLRASVFSLRPGVKHQLARQGANKERLKAQRVEGSVVWDVAFYIFNFAFSCAARL
jgi:hypothetical protein